MLIVPALKGAFTVAFAAIDPVVSATNDWVVGPDPKLSFIVSPTWYPVAEIWITSPGSADGGEIKFGATAKWTVMVPDCALALMSSPPAGSGGETKVLETDPVPSAIALTPLPLGKAAVTVSCGTKPTPEKVVVPAAMTFTGEMLPAAVMRKLALAVSPLCSPTAYSVCDPPRSGVGIGTDPAFQVPSWTVVNFVSNTPVFESSLMSTRSFLPKRAPDTPLRESPGVAVPVLSEILGSEGLACAGSWTVVKPTAVRARTATNDRAARARTARTVATRRYRFGRKPIELIIMSAFRRVK
jgi:hypothetical protein